MIDLAQNHIYYRSKILARFYNNSVWIMRSVIYTDHRSVYISRKLYLYPNDSAHTSTDSQIDGEVLITIYVKDCYRIIAQIAYFIFKCFGQPPLKDNTIS